MEPADLVTLIAAIIAGGVSLVNAILTSIFGLITSLKVSRIENIESHKKFDKNITNFELQFKNERWLADILEKDEFGYFNEKSQKRIYNWWVEYTKLHPPVILKIEVAYDVLKNPPLGRIKWGNNKKSTLDNNSKKPVATFKANIGGEVTEMVMPGDDDLPDPADLF